MKKGILVVSFGTTFPDAREKSITAIEQTIASTYPEYGFYRAFTSKIVRERILENEGIQIDSVPDALERMRRNGIQEVFIQSTHVIPGEEYDKVLSAVNHFRDSFQALRIGKPLLWAREDFTKLVSILDQQYHFSNCRDREAFILMGHGTEHTANQCYQTFQSTLQQQGFSHVLLPTVEGKPDFAQIFNHLQKSDYKKITLLPFMVVAGDHVNNDLFGEEEDSWKNQLLAAGYEVDGMLTGLGEIPAVRALFLSHFQDIVMDRQPA